MKKVMGLIGCIALLAFSSPGYEVGSTVADFKLKNVDGNMVSLADHT